VFRYGVSRVYLQQCGYVLSDAQSASNSMNLLLRTVKDSAIDPDAGRARWTTLVPMNVYCTLTRHRPEQLVLQDDPSFLPEYTMHPHDLSADFNLGFDLFSAYHSGDSQSLTPFGTQQSPSIPTAGAVGGLVLPSTSPLQHGEFRLKGDNDADSVSRTSDMFGTGGFLDLDEPDFTFGDDGGFIQLGYDEIMHRTPDVHGGAEMQSYTGVSARVRREHEQGRHAGAQVSLVVSSFVLCTAMALLYPMSSTGLIDPSSSLWVYTILPVLSVPWILTQTRFPTITWTLTCSSPAINTLRLHSGSPASTWR